MYAIVSLHHKHLTLASSINGLDSSSEQKRWRQSYIKAFQGGRLQFRWIIKLKCSLAVHFQSYPLAFAEKEQLATASAVFGNYDSTQRPFRSREMLNRYSKKAKPIRQNIRLRNTKCIQSDRSILGFSVQILVSHITNHNISHIAALHFWHNNRLIHSFQIEVICTPLFEDNQHWQ